MAGPFLRNKLYNKSYMRNSRKKDKENSSQKNMRDNNIVEKKK